MMLRRSVFIAITATLSSNALAVPLTRYFPDNALGVIEAKDLQEAIAQTGSFGEDTQKFLGAVLDEALSSKSGKQIATPGLIKDLTVRTMVSSIRDLAVGAYSVNGNPEFLAVVRLTPKNFIVNQLIKAFNDNLKTVPAKNKFREGNYLASLSGGIAVGVGNNLFYLSSNSDVLKGFLKRLNGQQLPVITNNASYNALSTDTGDGFFKQMIQYSTIAQMLQKDKTVPKRLLNALKTLNATASVSSIVTNGLETRSVTQLNPNGGDAALYKLLTYAPEKLELLNDLPSTAPSASILATDTSGWLDYVQSWLPELGFSTQNNREIIDTLSTLKDRLGNEWAVVNGNTPNTNSLISSLGLGLGGLNSLSATSLGILGAAGILGDIANPSSETVFYAKTKNGAAILTDLELALKDAIKPAQPDPTQPTVTPPQSTGIKVVGTPPTVERSTIAGFDAVVLKSVSDGTARTPQLELWIVNKRDTVIIGSNQAKIEGYINATPILENPLFKTVTDTSKVSALQYTAPVRLTRAEIDAMLEKSLKPLQGQKGTGIPKALVTAFADFMESWSSRTQLGFGYSMPDGNKLRSFNKTGFSWNK